jgi:sigma-B regulation protein RsbU (phosphoserine phosphatase)
VVSREAARRALHDELRGDDPVSLYERAPCGYLSTTPDGTIVKVNETFLVWTGYSVQDLVDTRTFAELLTPGGRIYYETHYAPMLRMQDGVGAIAVDIVKADGQRLAVLVSSTLERDPAGAPLVVRTAVFDATERREYERELLRAKQRAEDSEAHARALAGTLQQTFIPPTPPDVPELDVAAAYRPAGTGEEVGGDFYDIFQIGNGDWVVALGDVCGKGVDAAVVTTLVRHTLRAVTVQLHEPRQALEALNQILLEHETDRFCTVALLRLRHEDDGWRVTMSTGGHPLPVVSRPGRPPASFGQTGSLVGVLDAPVFHDSHTRLEPGAALVLYTDGVTEGRRGAEFYGEDRLRAAVAAHAGSAGSVVEGILADVLDFQRGSARDDIALVVLRAPETGPAS